MQNPSFSAIPAREAGSRLVHVVIDTPRGSRNKYKVDEKYGCLRLSRILPAGHGFPYDFGSIPGTCAEDGDALDVLVLLDAPTFPGCLLTVRLIGVLGARQRERGHFIRNDRLIACAQTPVNPPEFRRLRDVGSRKLDEIEHFFLSYNQAQGRAFRIDARSGPKKAQALLTDAIERFSSSKKKS